VIDRKALLKDLQGQVKALEKDLREQVEAVAPVGSALRSEYDRAFKLGRTAATWTVWRDERVTQAAVAWALGTVFVRFCEDNGLLGSSVYLAGPSAERMALAEESQEEYFRAYPQNTDRDWILEAFGEIASSQAGRSLFDPEHNAAYQIPVSHDAAKALIAFWRRRGEDGVLVHDFTDPSWDTRFLGDLYQDLSEAARKAYALLQTPEFVEEFILDLTLTPAIEEFGYDVVKMIDPTCGSGHFLLGTFHRLLAEWDKHAPNRDRQERVRLALDAVHGVDINPFAVAIARFRLLIAALRVAGFATLEETMGYDFPLHVAIGDSLIRDRQLSLFDDVDQLANFRFFTEDLDDYPGIVREGRYHVVVGNPPYVTVSDEAVSRLYRNAYPDVCHRQYALSAPFAQRLFELARRADEDCRGAGYVGQITANSFMKREFGKKLIEQFFANAVELTYVIDTSGAYIPGHGTPTVILVGRHRSDLRGDRVRAVLGIRGEPSGPEDPSKGYVWKAILDQIGRPGSESEWISVDDISRERLSLFPWSLSGGGASGLLQTLSMQETTLAGKLEVIGRTTHTGQDDAYYLPATAARRHCLDNASVPVVLGEDVRDFLVHAHTRTLFPYDAQGERRTIATIENHFYWPNRTILRHRVDFGQIPEQRGLRWFDHSMFFKKRYAAPLSIAFAFVATHNHFVLDRGGKVFKQSAPVIKLPEDASEDDHLRLLGVLNSSTACFWLKQVSHNKGRPGAEQAGADEPWEHRYEFTGTKLEEFPLPSGYPLEPAREVDFLAQRLAALSPAAVTAKKTPTRERLDQARTEWQCVRGRMIALQEELDWQLYVLYGLLNEEISAPLNSLPELEGGQRPFAIVLARQVAADGVETTWFKHHNHRFTPIVELPEHWSAEYRAIVEKRIAVIESNRNIGLIERPEYKRRWATEGWEAMQAKALRDWLLDRCETRDLWYHHVDGVEQPRPLSTSQLADELRRDPDVLAVAELYAPGKDLAKVIADLVADEHVPYLAALRYKDTGLAKRADWEHVWDLQRQEDAAPDEPAKKKIRDTIPVPPKYTSADFAKTSYWSNRGKLDVPKERFISYPHAGRDGDPSLLIGWAGWDHREQAQALAILIVEREQTDGWAADRLTPLLAGLREVLPWVRQWHGDFDAQIGDSPAVVYDAFLGDTTNRLHLTDHDLTGWRPPKTTRGRKSKA
jgi:hypothetical protein